MYQDYHDTRIRQQKTSTESLNIGSLYLSLKPKFETMVLNQSFI